MRKASTKINMATKTYDYCIVGAGPSGLTAAYRLLKAGKSVLLLERDTRVGGLAKSYDYDGHIFDTGPKRFHTDDPVVLDFIHEIVNNDILRIGRSTKVFFLGQYFEWPLQTQDVFKMPLGVSLKCCFDLMHERRVTDSRSFHQYVYSKYGETLYKIFFEPYTRKFLRWDPEDIHSDWASTGINRTTIDKRIKTNSLFELFKAVLLPAKIQTEFIYPSSGGFGGFYEKLLVLCQAHEGFHLIVNDRINGLDEHGSKFNALTQNKVSLSFNELIWTGNLNDLCRLADSEHALPYLNTIFYNLICREDGVGNQKAQWIYVSKGDSLVSRITCMKEFAPYTCREGYYNVICELTDSQTNPLYFHNPLKYTDGVLEELETMGFLKDQKYVADVKVNPVLDTYPIYHKKYNHNFAEAARIVRDFSPRIHLLGRCGAFWYNNSDHSIRFAIELTDKLLGKSKGDFDYRHYFGGTYGRAAQPQGT